MIRLTAWMDDKKSQKENIISEHGLSYFVEAGDQKFLFDCGQSVSTWHNAAALGLDAPALDAVILSHSHYDHAGGYRSAPEPLCPLLYTGDGFWEEKFSFDGITCQSRWAGFDSGFLKARGVSQTVVTDVTEIAPGIYLIGSFPRVIPFETIPEKYVRKSDTGFIWDDFRDEICMAIDVGGALAVLVGCAHPGILNMITRVHDALHLPVRAIYGGIHLLEVPESRITATLEGLHNLGVETFGLGHCSGTGVEAAIRRDERFRGARLCVGDSVILK